MDLRTASIVLSFFLIPTVALAESEDPCDLVEDEPPTLLPADQPLARDGWIALDPGYGISPITDVRLRDAAGREIETTAVFGERTKRLHEIFAPAEVLEPGSYELVFMHDPECFEPREVTIPVEVADRFAEPAAAPPVINGMDAVLYGDSLLSLDIHIEYPGEEDPPVWLLVDADFSDPEDPENGEIDTLFAPMDWPYVEFYRELDGEVVTEVCTRATFYDLAGTPSETTEFCTTEIEHLPFTDGGPLSCSVGGGGSPGWALGVLLGIALVRRRRGRA